jgi:hypothetical protein
MIPIVHRITASTFIAPRPILNSQYWTTVTLVCRQEIDAGEAGIPDPNTPDPGEHGTPPPAVAPKKNAKGGSSKKSAKKIAKKSAKKRGKKAAKKRAKKAKR